MRIITIWNLPWLVTKVIDWYSDRQACHHCAIEIGGMIYESTIPVVRKVSREEYRDWLSKVEKNWRYRLGREPLIVNYWELPESPLEEAEKWLGTKYSLKVYLKDRPDRMNCSKYVATILKASGYYYLTMAAHKYRPIDIEHVLKVMGFKPESGTK